MVNDVEHLVIYHPYTLFSEMSIYVFCLYSNLIFIVRFILFLIYYRYESFIRYVACKYFLQECSFSYCPLNWAFHRGRVLNFDVV